MKRLIIARIIYFTVFAFLSACNLNNKYTYITVVRTEVTPGRYQKKYMAAKTIERSTDSAAYLAAYVKFCIVQKAADSVTSSVGKLTYEPVEFMLIKPNGVDISKFIKFKYKDSLEKNIQKQILTMDLK